MTEKLLKAKKESKAKKPDFQRADAHKKKRLGSGWRRPRGWQNKMRLHKKGYRRVVKTGYGTPNEIKNAELGKGLSIVPVSTEKELLALDPKKQAAELTNVGRKKKELLIVKAKDKGIVLVNLAVAAYQEKTKALLAQKQNKKKALVEKEAKKAEIAKQAEEAAKKAEEATKKAQEKAAKETSEADEAQAEEQEKAAEKKEKDKVLTSKKGF